MSSLKEFIVRGVGVAPHLWNQWAVQILLLASFSLQVFLFLFGGTRRRGTSALLRVLLWLAYLTADTAATYTLGHLAINSGSHLHQLVAFWAPFLLLHLGGQDAITAYALEDNRLWLRHLQTLVVQFLGVAYVLYRYLSGSQGLISAGILMFIVGAVKYGERIWALKCANDDGIDCLTDKYDDGVLNSAASLDVKRNLEGFGMDEEEVVMHGAHVLLSICVSQFHDCTLKKTPLYQYKTVEYLVVSKKMYRVIEMELSLMYDIMYTKTVVIHTWYGQCTRLLSLLAITYTLLQFWFFINKDGYGRVDLDITYILVAGASVLEMLSWIMAIGSTWTRHLLYLKGWNRLYRVTVCLRRFVKALSWRRWSDKVGQFNMFNYAGKHASTDMDRYKLKDLPPAILISAHMKDLVLNEIMKIVERHGGDAHRVYSLNQKVEEHELPVLDCDFDTRIIIWHIATHAILLCMGDRQRNDGNCREAIKMLSDYMVFLLVKHPEMLAAHTSRQLCLEALELLKFVDTKELAEYLRAEANPPAQGQRRQSKTGETGENNDPCQRAMELARTLLGNGWGRAHLLKVMFGAWVVMLCYAGSHCSRDSHARRLSSGGELLTVVWQLARHLSHYESEKREQARKAAGTERWQEEDRKHSLRMSLTGKSHILRIQEDTDTQINQDAGEGTSEEAPDT